MTTVRDRPRPGTATPAGADSGAGSTHAPIEGLGAIVMAAGLGQRMHSKLAKVLHPVAGRPMVLYGVELAMRLAGEGVAVVVGHQGREVRAVIEAQQAMRKRAGTDRGQAQPLLVVEQAERLGTGHAVMQARTAIARTQTGVVPRFVILNGDTPLLAEATVRDLVRLHERDQAAVTILTAVLDDPRGYGRVVRGMRDGQSAQNDRTGRVLRIVEDRDAAGSEAQLHEINVGTYVVDGRFLFEALDELEPRNAQREYYLTDIVELAVRRGLGVSAMVAPEAEQGLGINDREQLAAAEQAIRRQIRTRWMRAGVTLQDPATTWIEATVQIGRDTVLYPHVTLEGGTVIGEACVIRSHTRITDSRLGDRAVVQDSCVIREASLEEETTVGPFAHLRPGSVVRRAARVGNFVEMKNAELGERSKANHLTYLGDARVGRGVNIGAGTITCNYDGVEKHETVVEDGVFIGSDTQLIAPVRVGRGAVVAAGSTVTHDVPPDALAIARAGQVNRAGWGARRRAVAAARGKLIGRQTAKKTTGVSKERARSANKRRTSK